jgi:hypothetical protein
MLAGNGVDVGHPYIEKNNYPTDLTALYIMSYEFYFKKLRNT